MGIRPVADPDNWTGPAADSAESRAADLLATTDHVGQVAGEAFGESYTVANSANDGAVSVAAELAELKKRVEALEAAPPSHSHTQTDVSGLTVVLDDIRRRLAALENPPV